MVLHWYGTTLFILRTCTLVSTKLSRGSRHGFEGINFLVLNFYTSMYTFLKLMCLRESVSGHFFLPICHNHPSPTSQKISYVLLIQNLAMIYCPRVKSLRYPEKRQHSFWRRDPWKPGQKILKNFELVKKYWNSISPGQGSVCPPAVCLFIAICCPCFHFLPVYLSEMIVMRTFINILTNLFKLRKWKSFLDRE